MSEHRNGIEMARAALAAAREAARNKRPIKKRERPARRSGDPQKFGAAISELINDRGWSEEMAVGSIMGRWESVVGQDLARHVTPTSFKEGILYLTAESTAWATEVRLLAPNLLRQLAREIGDGVVHRIEVAGPVAPSWRKGLRRAPGRGPRDTYG